MIRPKTTRAAILASALACLCAVVHGAAAASAFTYQGRLDQAGVPAQGLFDFRFALYDAGNYQIGSTLTNAAVTVSNGLFTVSLDFGASAFNSDGRWLEIAVRTGANAFTTLSPRQALTAAPYAVQAASASQAFYAVQAGTASQALSLSAGLAATLYPASNPNNFVAASALGSAAYANSSNFLSGIVAGSGISALASNGVVTVSATGTTTNTTPVFNAVPGVLNLGSGNVAVDAAAATHYRLVLTTNALLQTPLHGIDAQRLTFEFIQDAAGGRALTLDAGYVFGTDITGILLSTAPGKRDFMTTIYNASTDKWYVTGFVKGY